MVKLQRMTHFTALSMLVIISSVRIPNACHYKIYTEEQSPVNNCDMMAIYHVYPSDRRTNTNQPHTPSDRETLTDHTHPHSY